MRFLLDENADFQLAKVLKNLGHDVTTIVQDYPRSIKDREVLALAHEERRILITNDADFGGLVFRQQLPHSGIVQLRLGKENLETKIARLKDVLENHTNQLHHFIVVTNHNIRVRKTTATQPESVSFTKK